MKQFFSKLSFLFKKKIQSRICKDIINQRDVLQIKKDFYYMRLKDCEKYNKQLKINYQEAGLKLMESQDLYAELVKKLQKSKIKLNITSYIQNKDVRYLLKKQFPNAEIYLSDHRYGLITKEECINILLKDKTNTKKYISESHDCDDFSFILQGIFADYDVPFGILWISKPYAHGLNVVILKDKKERWKVWCVEPQNDRIYSPTSDYVAQMIIM